MFVVGQVIGLIEGWSVVESFYFSYVTGLTIGYGDFTPSMFITRLFAILIGLSGVLLMGLLAGIAMKALGIAIEQAATE